MHALSEPPIHDVVNGRVAVELNAQGEVHSNANVPSNYVAGHPATPNKVFRDRVEDSHVNFAYKCHESSRDNCQSD